MISRHRISQQELGCWERVIAIFPWGRSIPVLWILALVMHVGRLRFVPVTGFLSDPIRVCLALYWRSHLYRNGFSYPILHIICPRSVQHFRGGIYSCLRPAILLLGVLYLL